MRRGHAQARSLGVVAPAVRDRHDAGHDRIGHLDGHLDLAGARADAGKLPVAQPETLGVVGVDVRRAALLALHERLQVVHPRVVRAQLAAADQDHAAVAGSVERRPQARHILGDRLGRQLDLAAGGAQDLRDTRLERAEVDAVRRGLEVGQRQVVGAGAQRQVEQALGAAASVEHVGDGLRVDPGAARALLGDEAVDRVDVGVGTLARDDRGQAQHRLPLVRHAGRLVQQRGRVVRHVAHGQLVEGDVVVGVLERGGPGQDHVRVARRLVDVHVQRDHEVEPLQRRLETA